MEFQTRGDKIGYHPTMDAALIATMMDKSIWKISFTISDTGERVRLVRDNDGWVYETVQGERFR